MVLELDAVLQQIDRAGLVARPGKGQVGVVRERGALRQAHIGVDAVAGRDLGGDLARHAGVGLAVINVRQEQGQQHHPQHDQPARRQHHGAPQYRWLARHPPLDQEDPADGGAQGDDEGRRAKFGHEARQALEQVGRQFFGPAGQFGDPEQPQDGRQHGQHHHREPVDGVDGAALHRRQAEGGHDGERRQQLEQVAVFRRRVADDEQGQGANERQRQHDVQQMVLAAPCVDGPAGERPGWPEEPDAGAQEGLDRGPGGKPDLAAVPVQPCGDRVGAGRRQ